MKFYHKAGDKILDAGGGGNPYPLATTILEKYKKNVSRGKDVKIPKGVKYVWGDIEKMPFKDKEFDFVVCKHVLEHVNKPEKACAELQRVAKAGYIETPTPLWERLFGRRYHKWIIQIVRHRLCFQKNPWKPCFRGFFDKIYAHNPEFRVLFHKNIKIFYNRVLWRDFFPYDIYEK